MSGPSKSQTIAVLGGTGKEGRGLAYRWARAGYHVVVGSRSAEKAVGVATAIRGLLGTASSISGQSNLEAAREADVAVLTVPYASHRETLESLKEALAGKLLVDVTVPVVPGQTSRVHMPTAGSASQEAKAILGATVEVAAAFHSISYEHLMQDRPIDSDVLVTGSSKEARRAALELVRAAGLNGWDAGPLDNSVVSEGLASVLIHINRHYGSRQAGIRITGVEKSGDDPRADSA
jgi:NADPH-dependent F420 reductase